MLRNVNLISNRYTQCVELRRTPPICQMKALSPCLRKGFAMSALLSSLWEPPSNWKLLKEGVHVSYTVKPHTASDCSVHTRCYWHWPTEIIIHGRCCSLILLFLSMQNPCISQPYFTQLEVGPWYPGKPELAKSAYTNWRPSWLYVLCGWERLWLLDSQS